MAEDRRQKTDDRRQMTDDGRMGTVETGRKAESILKAHRRTRSLDLRFLKKPLELK